VNDPDARRRAGLHALLAYAAAAALVAGLVRIDVDVPMVGHLGSALVAVTLLYAPVVVAWRRGEDLADYGFRTAPVGRGVKLGVGYVLLVFPIFALGYFAFYEIVCSPDWRELRELAPPGACKAYRGIAGWHAPAITWDLVQFVAVQIVVVALPEELFFRGCLHELLERRFPPARRWLGGGVGLALVLSSLAFALIHLPKDGDPRALATFFPGLVFGWMRSCTGSILAPVIAHASSNILIRVLDLMVLTRP
jgi:membrane protease YdiL (CAAX protease family)